MRHGLSLFGAMIALVAIIPACAEAQARAQIEITLPGLESGASPGISQILTLTADRLIDQGLTFRAFGNVRITGVGVEVQGSEATYDRTAKTLTVHPNPLQHCQIER
jgi:hypothetical protein